MALTLRGHLVLTAPEFAELARLMPRGASVAPVLVALQCGDEQGVHPVDVFSALDIATRIASATSTDTQAVRRILDKGLDRLAAAFPGDVPQ